LHEVVDSYHTYSSHAFPFTLDPLLTLLLIRKALEYGSYLRGFFGFPNPIHGNSHVISASRCELLRLFLIPSNFTDILPFGEVAIRLTCFLGVGEGIGQ
jgi:hypothetical protein